MSVLGRDGVGVPSRDTVADLGQEIREGSFGSHVGVGGEPRKLGVHEREPRHGRGPLDGGKIEVFERVAGGDVGFADEDEIGLERIGIRKNGVIAKPKIHAEAPARQAIRKSPAALGG